MESACSCRREWHRDASRSTLAGPMARRQVPGHDSVWPDLALGLDAPEVAICQSQSASTDLGPVLPSHPHFLSISQAIFIRSACHPSLKEPISPLPLDTSNPLLPGSRPFDKCRASQHRQPRRGRQDMLAVGDARSRTQDAPLLLPAAPVSLAAFVRPEAGCQMLVNPLNLHGSGVGVGVSLVCREDGTLGLPPTR
jgi:hypothetical protein